MNYCSDCVMFWDELFDFCPNCGLRLVYEERVPGFKQSGNLGVMGLCLEPQGR